MEESMLVTEEQHDGIYVVTIDGRLDSGTAPSLDQSLTAAIASGIKRIIIDFVRIEYISSAGLRVILKTAKELKRLDGMLVLCSMADYIKEIFEISGFTAFLPIKENLHDAERVFKDPGQ
jgi:anti-sigma B factor antagonist